MTDTPGYRALTEAVAALLDSDRVVFEIRGKHALRVVNGLLTNSLDGLEEGLGRYAFALTAKGRPVAEMRVLPRPGFEEGSPGGGPETVWIDVPAAASEPFREHLARFVPPIFAEHRALDVVRLSLAGPAALALAAEIPGALELSPGRSVDGLPELGCASLGREAAWSGLLVRREDLEVPGLDVVLPAGSRTSASDVLRALAEASGGAAATPEDLDVVRIERGVPVYGREITGDTLPQETGQQDRAISFSKGCYTGQEVVARIHYRGKVNRHLRGLRAETGTALAAGVGLSADGKTVATVTSATTSPRLGPIGLGYVRREHEPGDRVTAPDGSTVAITALPFTFE